MPGSPGREKAAADDDIGCLDEGEFKVLIDCLGQVSIIGFSAAGFDRGGGTGIAGKVLSGGKAVDIANLAVDHN